MDAEETTRKKVSKKDYIYLLNDEIKRHPGYREGLVVHNIENGRLLFDYAAIYGTGDERVEAAKEQDKIIQKAKAIVDKQYYY
jgi:hypothetical protein